MSRIKPLNDFVLLERKDAEKVTAGGIHLPDSAKRPDVIECRVIDVGPGDIQHMVDLTSAAVVNGRSAKTELALMPVKKGDVVLVCENNLHACDHGGARMFFTHVGALFGVIEAD